MAGPTQRSGGSELLRVALILVVLVVGLPFVMVAVFAPMMGFWMVGGGHMGGLGGPEVALVALMLVPLLLVVASAAYLLRALRGDGGEDPALEELRRAYARGDLSDEEFERRRERLRD